MKVYTVHRASAGTSVEDCSYHGTKDGAAASAKAFDKGSWPDITVTEREMGTDKRAILDALNGIPNFGEPLRTWGMTLRGALKEE